MYLHYFDEKQGKLPENHHRKLRRYRLPFYKKPEICIHGHFNNQRNIGVIDYYPLAKQCIAILRDTLEIALSNYFYRKKRLREREDFRNGIPNEMEVLSVDKYLEDNISLIPFFMPLKVDRNNYQKVIDSYFVHIGIMEKLQESIDIIAAKLGKNSLKISHENVSRRENWPSNAAIRKFKNNNGLAYKIYDYVIKLNE
ncbi:hypothetical protein WJR50_21280 [Catalinimonas sp. 4WD22]